MRVVISAVMLAVLADGKTLKEAIDGANDSCSTVCGSHAMTYKRIGDHDGLQIAYKPQP